MHRVQALTRFPSNTEYCKLGKRRTMEALMLWERLIVREYVLLHIAQCRGMEVCEI